MKSPKDNTALLHSQKLSASIREKIKKAGGFLSFARFMELALYTPGLGYYSGGALKFGISGDFVTAPEISSTFGECIATQSQKLLSDFSESHILEFGGGSGKLARDLLLALEKKGALPRYYFILEVSATLREDQYQLLKKDCPHLLPHVVWLDTLTDESITGLILANEVMDAIPFERFRIKDQKVYQLGVAFENNQFELQENFSPELEKTVKSILEIETLPEGYTSEISLLLPPWIKTLGRTLKQGIILLFDYGYGRREYYHPGRNNGTFSCFYQHRVHDNPFFAPGLQDITANVDFTLVAESGVNEGLTLKGYTTQGAFLLESGLLTLPTSIEERQAIKKLILPSEMGELVKTIVFSKNMEDTFPGLTLQDRRHDL